MNETGRIGCFGEVLLRLGAPRGSKIANASNLSVHCAGSEANVGAMLAQLGHDTEIFTVLPSSPLGDLCEAELRRTALSVQRLVRTEGRLGLYFLEPGGAAGGRIIYDRKDSAFADHADEFDWAAVSNSLRWFHLSGINLALGGKPAASALAAIKAMRSAGVPVSFDVNHRASLWEPQQNFDVVREAAAMSRLLFASQRDICRMLGLELPDQTKGSRRSAAEAAFDAFEDLQMVASTQRTTRDARPRLSARVDTRDGSYETDEADLGPVVDRIGSGDAFAASVLDAMLSGQSPERCARQGLGAAVMKHGIAGDRWIGNRADLESFDPFGSEDVRR